MTPYTEKYQPKSLEDFAGLKVPKAILSRVAASPYQSAWLLLGPAGVGKTTMAYAFAEAVKAQVHHIPSRKCDLETVDAVCHACHYVPMMGMNWHVVIVDEADQMTRAAQLAFLSKLDSTAFPPNTIFVFTANDKAGLEGRFLSRCRTLEFSPPPPAIVGQLLRFIWFAENGGKAAPDVDALIEASGGNVRDALMRLELESLAV